MLTMLTMIIIKEIHYGKLHYTIKFSMETMQSKINLVQ